MRYLNTLAILVLAIMTLVLSGCGSDRDSSGSISGGTDVLANAETVGITNCLTCHNTNTVVTDGWLNSRHANTLSIAEKEALNPQGAFPPHQDDNEDGLVPPQGRPNYDHGSICFDCHDKLGDGRRIDSAVVGENERPIISCESCHGGGQFHNGIAAGIPNPAPTVNQCNQCHGDTVELFHRTSGGGDGTNVRRNITDSHIDDPATRYENPQVSANVIEGYVIINDTVGGCNSCHIAHLFDLTINNQWASSPHAGDIRGAKEPVIAAGAVDGATLLANVKAAGVTSATGDGWLHYDWDDSLGNGPGGRDRSSCQRCHTATGLKNFLADTANYNAANNDFSHLDGWAANKWSGQNELLYCWGCHVSVQTGELRDDPNGITLDFLFEDPTGATGPANFVVLPDKGNSNVCGACHAGRGNNTSIRTSYAEEAAAAAADGPGGELGGLSSRFSGHHAPTAGSLYAAVTHTGFEFENPPGTPLDYTTPALEHDLILEDSSGPCAGCHMGGPEPHLFAAVDRTGATVINNQALCDSCHGGAIDGAFLDTLQANFEAARAVLDDLVDNVTPNYLGIDISASANRNAETLSVNDFGAFQNSLYMNEEPCIRVHNSLYGKRLMFDSIDWLEDGTLDGTITPNLTWLGGTTRP